MQSSVIPSPSSSSLHSNAQQQAMSNLVRGLIESDHELAEAERRAKRMKQQQQLQQLKKEQIQQSIAAEELVLSMRQEQQMRQESAFKDAGSMAQPAAASRSHLPVRTYSNTRYASNQQPPTNATHARGAFEATTEQSSTHQSFTQVHTSSSTSKAPQTQNSSTNHMSFQMPIVAPSSGSGLLRVNKASTKSRASQL